MRHLFLISVLATLASADKISIEREDSPDTEPAANLPRHISGSLYATRFSDVTWDNDAWTLTATNIRPDDYRAISTVANGYFGISMASNGPFVQAFEELSGWPLYNQRQTFGTVGGFYDRQPKTNGTNFAWLSQYGWDSVISGIPAWCPLILDLGNGTYLDANTSTSELSDVQLIQDYHQGLASYQYDWTPKNHQNLTISIQYTVFAHKLYLNRAYVQLEFAPSQDINLTAVNVIDGFNALRTDPVTTGSEANYIYSAVSPWNVANVQSWIYACIQSNSSSSYLNITDKPYIAGANSSIAQGLSIQAKANHTITVTKYVGIASTDAFASPQSQARSVIDAAIAEGYDAAFQLHVAEWATVLPNTGVSNYSDPSTGLIADVPQIIEKAIIQVVSTFGLLMNTISENAYKAAGIGSINIQGIAVPGLLNDAYGGQRFWDQDIWMKPILNAVFPFAARQVVNQRISQYNQAIKNVGTAYQSSKNQTAFSPTAAIYPWTNGRDGNCTATGPCFDYEYHLNGDIILSFVDFWAATGDTSFFQQELYPITIAVATLFSDLLIQNDTQWAFTNVTDPDEYANHVDNGGYTNPLIASTLQSANDFAERFGMSRNATFDQQALNILVARTNGISLEYTGMNASIDVKQADVVLDIFPLDYQQNYTTADQIADLDYYAGRQSPDGPGMTFAIFSIAATGISPSGCSGFTYDVQSYDPYARAPWYWFAENQSDEDTSETGQQNHAFPFLTGHGGALQIDLYGYLGLRYNTSCIIEIDPTLPPQIPNLRFPTFYQQGWPITAVSNRTHTMLTRGTTPLAEANMTYATASLDIAVGRASSPNQKLYQLSPNSTLTIPNNMALFNRTVPGNILQCGSATTYQNYTPGQFPIAAIDGAISTLWQPLNASVATSMTVDLSSQPFVQIMNMTFDWAQAPPTNATVVFHNQSCVESSPGRVTIRLEDISISNPFNISTANVVTGYQSNSSFVDLKDMGIWTGNYATLTVVGNQNSSETMAGAQVAEWAVIGAGL